MSAVATGLARGGRVPVSPFSLFRSSSAAMSRLASGPSVSGPSASGPSVSGPSVSGPHLPRPRVSLPFVCLVVSLHAISLLVSLVSVGCSDEEPTNPGGPGDVTLVDAALSNDAVDAAIACNAVSDCPDFGTPCVEVTCGADHLCVAATTDDDTPCDDDPCTANDGCHDGACAGEASCACENNAQCASREDGDLCNGTLYCDLTTHTCAVAGGSVVVCDDSGDWACETNACQPTTGACAMTKTADGGPCDDGEPCTKDDLCAGGQCVGEAARFFKIAPEDIIVIYDEIELAPLTREVLLPLWVARRG